MRFDDEPTETPEPADLSGKVGAPNAPRPCFESSLMNRVAFLDHLSALGIPHDLTVRELEARYGVRKSTYYDWPVIGLSGARPLVPGQVEPPDLQPRMQPDLLPPPHFDAHVATDADARKNHARTLEYLTALLGAPTHTATSNTLGHRWTLDTAFVSLVSWPPDLQGDMPVSNPAHDRHPEMNAFAHLTFGAGHLVPLSAREREWMTSALSLLIGGASPPWQWNLDPLYSPLRGCLRRAPPELPPRRGVVGFSADSAALVGIDGEYGFVLPKELVVGVDLVRMTPARGRGGSRLCLRYKDPHTSKGEERSKDILTGASPASLDGAAWVVARWAEVEVAVSEYPDD